MPEQPGYLKRRCRLAETIDGLCGVFVSDSPGGRDPIVLLDSPPVEMRPLGRNLEALRTRRHAAMANAAPTRAGSGACACTRAAILAPADQKEREVALRLLPIALRGAEALVCDKGCAGRDFEQLVGERFGARVLRPSRADEPDNGLHLEHPPARGVGLLDAQGRGSDSNATARARSPASAPAWPSKLLPLAAGVRLNRLLDRPTRAFAGLAV